MGVRRSVTSLAATVAVVAAVGACVTPTAAALPPTLWIYPSTACPVAVDHGLQDCIDHAANGDTIALDQEFINETALVNRSLTLMPLGSSFHPQLDYLAIGDVDVSGQRTIDVTVTGLRVSDGIDGTIRYGTDVDHVTIKDVVVGEDLPSTRGIRFSAVAPLDLDVEHSYARTTQHDSGALQMSAIIAAGTSTFRAVGNTVTQHNAPNHNSGSGIEADMSGGGTMNVDIYNNKVWDVVGSNAGVAAGISLYSNGTTTMRANVVGKHGGHGGPPEPEQRHLLA
jgi:hypothetical protein